jgi:hypothetical protein
LKVRGFSQVARGSLHFPDRKDRCYDEVRSAPHHPEKAHRICNQLTFAEIEQILRAPLPATARQRNQWWANETTPESRHVQCHALRDAGYKAVPDLSRQTVIFKKLYV